MRRSIYLILVLGYFSVFPAQAGLESQMSKMFADMINVTPGGAYETQRRGVITGGSLVTRNRIAKPNLVSFVPPSLKAGCNGIDLFGGSFSFINSDQFTQLLRNIAQAAVGYAFQLALEGMCPTCAQVISKLQKDIAQINGLMRNSCEAAKFVVDNTVGPGLESINEAFKSNLAADLGEEGFITDFFAGFSDKSKSPDKKAIEADRKALFTGNVVYESLKHANAKDWYVDGDNDLLLVLMSLTGTYIVTTDSGDAGIQYDYRPHILNPREVIEGGKLTVYDCESDACLLPDDSRKEIVVTGMRERVRNLLVGTGLCAACTGGILRKASAREGGEEFSEAEKKFIESTSPGAYGLLRRMLNEPDTALMYAERMVDILAVELTNQLIDEMFDTVRNAVTSAGKQLDTKIMAALNDRKAAINESRRSAGEALAGVGLLISLHQNIVSSLRAPIHHKTH